MRARFRFLSLWFLFAAILTAHDSPPEFLRWRSYEAPDFPPQLLSTGVRDGFAKVMFTFDDNGRITDRVVLAASHPAFSQAVFEAMQHWSIDTEQLTSPARREFIRYNFSRGNDINTMGQRDANKRVLSPYGDLGAIALATCREEEIDAPLRELATTPVAYPAELKAQNVRGSAALSFVLGIDGRVRVPAVTDATEPEFGAAVLAAVQQWRFAPAYKDGRPVQVLVERFFRFGAQREKPSSSPADGKA